ncbi:MAG: site-2 protease family protein [Candidatus Aenigmarchaeota archaeon]|nr:site-2 protease family protein [Candidatus Aenigmarchaeota archaeon]
MKMQVDEIKDIITASIALIFIFSYPEFLSDASILVVSAMAIATGFVLHELSHRLIANKFGVEARFRIWRNGLIMALLLAVVTNGSFVFAAPGAVVINNFRFSFRQGMRPLGKREYGIISAAGPVTNLVLALIFLAIHSIVPLNAFVYATSINVSLALFNMIPIPPLDGSKVISWDPAAWAVIVGSIIFFRTFLI